MLKNSILKDSFRLIKITLLIIILISSYYLIITWQAYLTESSITSTHNLDNIQDKLAFPSAPTIDNKFLATLKPTKEVNIKIEKDFLLTANKSNQQISGGRGRSIQRNGPSTNLPNFLVNQKKKFLLVAISNASATSKAIIENLSSNQTYILKEGDQFQEFLVKKIKKKNIVLRHKDVDYGLSFSGKMRRLQ